MVQNSLSHFLELLSLLDPLREGHRVVLLSYVMRDNYYYKKLMRIKHKLHICLMQIYEHNHNKRLTED